MEVGVACASSLCNSSWIVTEKGKARGKPNGFFRCSQSFNQIPGQIILKAKEFQCKGKNLSKFVDFRLSCCFYENTQVSAAESETNHASIDEALALKKKSHDVATHLSGHCIYLVGMMSSGKTTIGKILAEVLGYSFFDSDKLVEQAVGLPVDQIIHEYSEDFFRNKETEVLQSMSFMSRLVVATGGGAVIEEKNWNYMKRGITIWLDVPLETLARRIVVIGTKSRSLLQLKYGATYPEVLQVLSKISIDRGGKYENAKARVCLENIASKVDLGDISDLTPTAIAIEALVQIENLLKERWTS